MQRLLCVRVRVRDDSGMAAPTPLFVAYLASLGLSGAAALRAGVRSEAMVDFLLLAAIVSGTVLVLFALVMTWAARAGQRAAVISVARPGAIVLRASRARGTRRAVGALRGEVRLVPLGLTLLADHTGFEVWCGSPEHPVRLGRIAWDAVVDIRASRVTRLGRASGGITVVVRDAADGALVEVPFLVLGSGLGGLGAPTGPELENIACALGGRRTGPLENSAASAAPLEQKS